MSARAARFVLLAGLWGPALRAAEVVPPLSVEVRHPSGAFAFRTPEGWTVSPGAQPGRLEVLAAPPASGARLVFAFEPRDLGFDGLHVNCMDQRLRGPMETDPRVDYEYDFLSATLGERRVLDSAFVVRYEPPVDGQREWRQRNLTVAGEQQSLCVIVHAPRKLWKKSPAARAVLDAVVQSVSFSGRRLFAPPAPASAPPR